MGACVPVRARVVPPFPLLVTVTEKNGQTKMQYKDAYENYNTYDIVPCSGRIAPEPCGVVGYPM